MLTGFFAQSKPINNASIVLLVLVFFILFHLFFWPLGADFWEHLSHLSALLIFLLTLGLLNFVVKRNILTKKSSYTIYFFALYGLSLPVLFDQPAILLSGMFIMLALRRIVSLRTQQEVQKKIFDAALWIFLASLFYFSSVLFIAVLYMGILLYVAGSYKNWLIPLVALLIMALFVAAYALATQGGMVFVQDYVQFPNYDYTAYASPGMLAPISFLLAMYLWCVFRYLGMMGNAPKKLKPSYILVLMTSIVALLIAGVFAHAHDGGEIYFLIMPLAIISSRYVDKSKSKWFVEMLLWLTLAIPVLLLIFWT